MAGEGKERPGSGFFFLSVGGFLEKVLEGKSSVMRRRTGA